jgi:hypothetical protein
MVRWLDWRVLVLAMLMVCFVRGASGQGVAPQKVADGVWFLVGDSSKGYSNTTIIEMENYLIVVDANYPARAKELFTISKGLSRKPVRYVFDTHAQSSTRMHTAIIRMAIRCGPRRERRRWLFAE